MYPIEFGRYQLLEKIGAGGMAEIFCAKAQGAEGFERLVAIKRINPNLVHDEQFLTMFIDEANISSQLNHPNICQIFDLGAVNEQYYIALEHIHGRDLKAIFRALVRTGRTMPVEHACWIAAQMCEGLHYAHNCTGPDDEPLNLVHRDISLQNILVSFTGDVKLIDFGIAKAAGRSTQTQAGFVKGKFAYMSPEQLRGLPVDRRSDVFSTGIVLFELLTGQRLFLAESTIATVRKVRDAVVTPPSTLNRGIPAELEQILLRALSKHREDRFQDAADLADALRDFARSCDHRSGRKQVGAWLIDLFAEEYAQERRKLSGFRRKLVRPPTASVLPNRASTSSWAAGRASLPKPPQDLDESVEIVFESAEAGDDRPDDTSGTLVGWVPYDADPEQVIPTVEISREEAMRAIRAAEGSSPKSAPEVLSEDDDDLDETVELSRSDDDDAPTVERSRKEALAAVEDDALDNALTIERSRREVLKAERPSEQNEGTDELAARAVANEPKRWGVRGAILATLATLLIVGGAYFALYNYAGGASASAAPAPAETAPTLADH